MAFWSMTSSLSVAGATDKVLDRDSFSLTDLLICDDILNQVLAPNDRVIQYLSQPEVICELVDLALAPPYQKKDANVHDENIKSSHSGHLEDVTDKPETHRNATNDNNEDSSFNSNEEEKESSDSDSAALTEPVNENPKGNTRFTTTTPAFEYESFSETGESFEYSEFQDDSLGSAVIAESDDELEEEERLRQLRLSKISAEILTTDVWTLLDALLSNETAMTRMWNLLDNSTPEASTQQLTLLIKIVEGLLEKRLDRMIDFIRTLPTFVDYFIHHIECQPLIDFLIKVISTDHPESPTDIIDFLYEQDLIPKMIELLGPDVSHGVQSAVGDFLKAFVNISGGNKSDICAIGPNELSRQFVGQKCMQRLIDLMLHGSHGMCVAVTVIIEVIRKNNSDYDFVEVMDTTLETHPPEPRDNIYLGTMVKLFAKAIPKFQEMLETSDTRVMKMPIGEIHPLGFERFRICELYAELLHCSNMNLLNEPRGEEVIYERDLQRVKVYYPERLSEFTEANKSQDESETLAPAELDNKTKDKAESTLTQNTITEDNLSQPEIAIRSPEIAPSADPPIDSSRESPPRSPIQLLSSPLDSLSPHTPEFESGEDLDYSNADQQKIKISSCRGQALEEQLLSEIKTAKTNSVIGDRLKIALDENKCVDVVVKMLFEYPWNNFLHNVVFDIVQQVFNGYMDHSYNKFLAINLFTRADLTSQIVTGHRTNDQHERDHQVRLGYVGHLTLISEEVVKFESVFVSESISPQVHEKLSTPEWLEYVQNDLLHLREQYNTVLGKPGSLIEEEESFGNYDEDEARMRSMELGIIDNSDTQFTRLRHRPESESESESDSESDSDSDGEHTKNAELEGEEEDEEEEEEEEEEVVLALTPQRIRHSNDSEDELNLDYNSSQPNGDENSEKKSSDSQAKQDRGTSASGESNSQSIDNSAKSFKSSKIPQDESEFARYMSKHLNQGQFDSESSEDEDEAQQKKGEKEEVPKNNFKGKKN